VIATDLCQLSLDAIADRLGFLRNAYRGHGATLDDRAAVQILQDYLPDLQALLERLEFLTTLSLLCSPHPTGDKPPAFKLTGLAPVLTTPLAPQKEASDYRLSLFNEANGVNLNLYPLVIFDSTRTKTGRVLFVNSWDKKKCHFLDYATGDHIYSQAPNTRLTDLQSAFPRPPTPDDALHPEYFTQDSSWAGKRNWSSFGNSALAVPSALWW
jgi:hypothetical protein